MSRTRSSVIKSEVMNLGADNRYIKRSGGTCTSGLGDEVTIPYTWNSANSYPQVYSAKTMTDVVIPEFKRRSAEGEIFINPMVSEHVSWEQTPLVMNHLQVDEQYGCTPSRWYTFETRHYKVTVNPFEEFVRYGTTTHMPSIADLVDVDALSDYAISKAWANIDQSKIQGLVTLAEAGKSLDTIQSTTYRGLKIIRGGRKKALRMIYQLAKSKKTRKQLADDLADLYLEIRYGLRPMYYDIVGGLAATDAICNPQHGVKDRITTRGFRNASGTNPGHVVLYNGGTGYGANLYVDHTYSDRWAVEARAGVLSKVKITALKVLGLDILGQTAWELVPFSFIIDWFFNTADIIGSWSPQPNVQPLGSWVTLRSIVTRTGRYARVYSDGSSGNKRTSYVPSGEASGGSYQVVVSRVERIPSPSRPILPSVAIRLDPLKILDIGLIAKGLAKEKREFKGIQKFTSSLRF